MKVIGIIIWILILTAGIWIKRAWIDKLHSEDTSVKARIALKRYHQLVSSDLKISGKINLDDLVGKHLVRDISPGDSINTTDVTDFPSFIASHPDSLLSLLYLTKEEVILSKTAQLGNWYMLCCEVGKETTQRACLDSIKLLVVHDSTKLSPENIWVVQIAKKKAGSLSEFIASGNRNILFR